MRNFPSVFYSIMKCPTCQELFEKMSGMKQMFLKNVRHETNVPEKMSGMKQMFFKNVTHEENAL